MVAFWESGQRDLTYNTLVPWLNHKSEWVRNFARDVLASKFGAGATPTTPAPANGAATKATK